MVHTLADEFTTEVAQLCATTVTDRQWAKFLDHHVPLLDPASGQPLTGRSLTMADKKRTRLEELYRHDHRVSPWAGTAYGVLQAVNTWEHHDSVVRRAGQSERKHAPDRRRRLRPLDRNTWHTLSTVLAAAN